MSSTMLPMFKPDQLPLAGFITPENKVCTPVCVYVFCIFKTSVSRDYSPSKRRQRSQGGTKQLSLGRHGMLYRSLQFPKLIRYNNNPHPMTACACNVVSKSLSLLILVNLTSQKKKQIQVLKIPEVLFPTNSEGG